ncbi:MAG TPA: ImmA/IrrE family metallo-endopeptidase [Thermoanaerobaculia bacterium]
MDRGQDEIEREPRRLLNELERRKTEIWDSPPDHRIDRIDPFKIVTHLLRVTLYEPEEIPHPRDYHPIGNVPSRIAGYIARNENTIGLARRFNPEIRRFTLAHEIGHWQLHKGEVYFRDFPLTAGDRSGSNRPLVEREANRFAEELLMPRELVRAYFRQIFGLETLRDQAPDEPFARRLSFGTNQRVTVADLIERGRDRMAFLVAEYKENPVDFSLAERFRVSVTAMSIRLMRLRLV